MERAKFENSHVATVACYSTELLHCSKFKNGDGDLVRWKPTYYIPLKIARRGEHNEIKNSWNGWAVLGENWMRSFQSKNEIEQSEPWLIKLTLQIPSSWSQEIVLRAWLNFKSFKLVRPRTRKSGPKVSWSNSIPEYYIDWINIVDQLDAN
jgi:hypothetical protein